MGDYEIRELELRDVDSLLECFNAVFSRDDASFRPRTRAEWSWAFEQNPAGRRAFVALDGEHVVAQFAAIPERVWVDGRERVFSQGVDSMVHPDHRVGLKHASLFVATARACFAKYGGSTDVAYYGLPVDAAWRIGHRMLGYELVRTELALVRELASAPPSAMPSGVAEIARFDEQTKWLWDRCADELRVSAIRDAAHFNWRFVDHPRARYTCLGARDEHGVLRGVAVFRRAKFVLDDLGVLVEWLVPSGEPEVADALLAALVECARRERSSALAALVPPWSSWFAWFQERGFLVHPTDYRLASVTFGRAHDEAWLRENWWLQLSDTDLV